MQRSSFQTRYAQVTAGAAPLRAHPEPAHLLDYLHREGEPERKNACLRALLVLAGGPDADPILTVLILALWPGLDAARGRLLRYYRRDPGVLDAELIGRLSMGICKADPERVRRVAATLLRNLERDLRRDLMREARHRADDKEIARDLQPRFDVPAAEQEPGIDVLVRALADRLGKDADVIILVAIDGLSQKDAARRLGISHDAARKRYQRTMRRLSLEAGP